MCKNECGEDICMGSSTCEYFKPLNLNLGTLVKGNRLSILNSIKQLETLIQTNAQELKTHNSEENGAAAYVCAVLITESQKEVKALKLALEKTKVKVS